VQLKLTFASGWRFILCLRTMMSPLTLYRSAIKSLCRLDARRQQKDVVYILCPTGASNSNSP
jgi:hypothetical protein